MLVGCGRREGPDRLPELRGDVHRPRVRRRAAGLRDETPNIDLVLMREEVYPRVKDVRRRDRVRQAKEGE
jgi:hypothetical protein